MGFPRLAGLLKAFAGSIDNVVSNAAKKEILPLLGEGLLNNLAKSINGTLTAARETVMGKADDLIIDLLKTTPNLTDDILKDPSLFKEFINDNNLSEAVEKLDSVLAKKVPGPDNINDNQLIEEASERLAKKVLNKLADGSFSDELAENLLESYSKAVVARQSELSAPPISSAAKEVTNVTGKVTLTDVTEALSKAVTGKNIAPELITDTGTILDELKEATDLGIKSRLNPTPVSKTSPISREVTPSSIAPTFEEQAADILVQLTKLDADVARINASGYTTNRAALMDFRKSFDLDATNNAAFKEAFSTHDEILKFAGEHHKLIEFSVVNTEVVDLLYKAANDFYKIGVPGGNIKEIIENADLLQQIMPTNIDMKGVFDLNDLSTYANTFINSNPEYSVLFNQANELGRTRAYAEYLLEAGSLENMATHLDATIDKIIMGEGKAIVIAVNGIKSEINGGTRIDGILSSDAGTLSKAQISNITTTLKAIPTGSEHFKSAQVTLDGLAKIQKNAAKEPTPHANMIMNRDPNVTTPKETQNLPSLENQQSEYLRKRFHIAKDAEKPTPKPEVVEQVKLPDDAANGGNNSPNTSTEAVDEAKRRTGDSVKVTQETKDFAKDVSWLRKGLTKKSRDKYKFSDDDLGIMSENRILFHLKPDGSNWENIMTNIRNQTEYIKLSRFDTGMAGSKDFSVSDYVDTRVGSYFDETLINPIKKIKKETLGITDSKGNSRTFFGIKLGRESLVVLKDSPQFYPRIIGRPITNLFNIGPITLTSPIKAIFGGPLSLMAPKQNSGLIRKAARFVGTGGTWGITVGLGLGQEATEWTQKGWNGANHIWDATVPYVPYTGYSDLYVNPVESDLYIPFVSKNGLWDKFNEQWGKGLKNIPDALFPISPIISIHYGTASWRYPDGNPKNVTIEGDNVYINESLDDGASKATAKGRISSLDMTDEIGKWRVALDKNKKPILVEDDFGDKFVAVEYVKKSGEIVENDYGNLHRYSSGITLKDHNKSSATVEKIVKKLNSDFEGKKYNSIGWEETFDKAIEQESLLPGNASTMHNNHMRLIDGHLPTIRLAEEGASFPINKEFAMQQHEQRNERST